MDGPPVQEAKIVPEGFRRPQEVPPEAPKRVPRSPQSTLGLRLEKTRQEGTRQEETTGDEDKRSQDKIRRKRQRPAQDKTRQDKGTHDKRRPKGRSVCSETSLLPLPCAPRRDLDSSWARGLGEASRIQKGKISGYVKMDPQRAYINSKPSPPKRSRVTSEAFAPGGCRPWPGALGVPGDAFWSVLDRFKAIELLRAPSPPARILRFAFFRARFIHSPPGCSRVQCCLGGPGGEGNEHQ